MMQRSQYGGAHVCNDPGLQPQPLRTDLLADLDAYLKRARKRLSTILPTCTVKVDRAAIAAIVADIADGTLDLRGRIIDDGGSTTPIDRLPWSWLAGRTMAEIELLDHLGREESGSSSTVSRDHVRLCHLVMQLPASRLHLLLPDCCLSIRSDRDAKHTRVDGAFDGVSLGELLARVSGADPKTYTANAAAYVRTPLTPDQTDSLVRRERAKFFGAMLFSVEVGITSPLDMCKNDGNGKRIVDAANAYIAAKTGTVPAAFVFSLGGRQFGGSLRASSWTTDSSMSPQSIKRAPRRMIARYPSSSDSSSSSYASSNSYSSYGSPQRRRLMERYPDSHGNSSVYTDPSSYGNSSVYTDPSSYGNSSGSPQRRRLMERYPDSYGNSSVYTDPSSYGNSSVYTYPSSYGNSSSYGTPQSLSTSRKQHLHNLMPSPRWPKRVQQSQRSSINSSITTRSAGWTIHRYVGVPTCCELVSPMLAAAGPSVDAGGCSGPEVFDVMMAAVLPHQQQVDVKRPSHLMVRVSCDGSEDSLIVLRSAAFQLAMRLTWFRLVPAFCMIIPTRYGVSVERISHALSRWLGPTVDNVVANPWRVYDASSETLMQWADVEIDYLTMDLNMGTGDDAIEFHETQGNTDRTHIAMWSMLVCTLVSHVMACTVAADHAGRLRELYAELSSDLPTDPLAHLLGPLGSPTLERYWRARAASIAGVRSSSKSRSSRSRPMRSQGDSSDTRATILDAFAADITPSLQALCADVQSDVLQEPSFRRRLAAPYRRLNLAVPSQ